MTIKELIEELSNYPDDLKVWKAYNDIKHAAHGMEEITEVYRGDGDDFVILDSTNEHSDNRPLNADRGAERNN